VPVIQDKEFGRITVKRNTKATAVRVRVAPNGTLRVSAPLYTPLLVVRRIIQRSRGELRDMIEHHHGQTMQFSDDIKIGKSHHLIVQNTEASKTTVRRVKQRIMVHLTKGDTINEPVIQEMIRDVVTTALRREAKSYLPKRLQYLATQHGYSFTKVRFSHASSRWGSCSSNGTISLNIALMKLPFEQIDYVLLHELTHTEHMNHSPEFWQAMETTDPQYKIHKNNLKQVSPSL